MSEGGVRGGWSRAWDRRGGDGQFSAKVQVEEVVGREGGARWADEETGRCVGGDSGRRWDGRREQTHKQQVTADAK